MSRMWSWAWAWALTRILAGITLFLCAGYVHGATEDNPDNLDIKVSTVYGLLIDAGSGGSRLHVFNWPERIFTELPPGITFPTSNEAWTARMSPGVATLTSFDAVKAHLAPLLDFAVATLIDVETEFSNIPIFFKATGGMRELPLDQRETIISYVRTLFLDKTFNPFFFHYEMARIISGEEEAVFSWACVNYLFGTLLPAADLKTNNGNVKSGSKSKPIFGPVVPSNGTFGTVDLGGASTQIAFFVESQDISEGLFKLQLGSSRHWNVYTKSFLQFGHQSARDRHVHSLADERLKEVNATLKRGQMFPSKNLTAVDPCFYSGYSELVSSKSGSLNGPTSLPRVILSGPDVAHPDAFERCKEATRPLLMKYTNSYCDVVYNGQCSINGAYQPSVTASEQVGAPGNNAQHVRHFIGTSSYMYPWEILLLNQTSTLEEYAKQAKFVCSMDYDSVVQYSNDHNLGVTDKVLSTMTQDYCFMVSYVYLLLTEGYGFPKNQTFTVLDVINGNTVGWAFGAIMYEINTMPWRYAPEYSMVTSNLTLLITGLSVTLVLLGSK
jgi:Golgi nucleoside diphosphatase